MDSNHAVWDTTLFDTVPVLCPEAIINLEYDKIIIATIGGYETVFGYLTESLNVPTKKIDVSFVKERFENTLGTRNRFLRRFAEIAYEKNLPGNVVEGGVFEGYFAKRINEAFPDKTLYLFDTFDGFDERDIAVELGDTRNRSNHFKTKVTQDDILNAMPYPGSCVIRKGYFPETAEGIDDEFLFVNLDFDLYNPTLAGLEFFYPRLVKGGVILVHDYFGIPSATSDSVIEIDKNLQYQGAFMAVNEFSKKYGVSFIPIGDELSVALVK